MIAHTLLSLWQHCCIRFSHYLLSTDVTNTLVSAFIFSRLDYWNSLLSGCPQYLLNKLQKVQNNAARLVLTVSNTDHISPYLASLHWCPLINGYSTNSLLSIIIASTRLLLTTWLSSWESIGQPANNAHPLVLPFSVFLLYTHTLGQRSFSYTSPSVWYTLPYTIRSSNTLSSFKSSLKTSFPAVVLIVCGQAGMCVCDLVACHKVWEFFSFLRWLSFFLLFCCCWLFYGPCVLKEK